MDEENVKKDPVKLHKDSIALYESGNYAEAKESFLETAKLYRKSNNFFDAATMLFKAGECEFLLKDYASAIDLFLESADLSFDKGFDRFGVSAWEYARDCYRAMGNPDEAAKLHEKIKEVKVKLANVF